MWGLFWLSARLSAKKFSHGVRGWTKLLTSMSCAAERRFPGCEPDPGDRGLLSCTSGALCPLPQLPSQHKMPPIPRTRPGGWCRGGDFQTSLLFSLLCGRAAPFAAGEELAEPPSWGLACQGTAERLRRALPLGLHLDRSASVALWGWGAAQRAGT